MKFAKLLIIIIISSTNYLFVHGVTSVSQTGSTYYVSRTGNNSNDGLSPANAWQSIAKINSTNFLPGDSILFEGGSTFNGNIYLDSADGNLSTLPITVSSYGSGKATINSGNSFSMFIYNSQGFDINNLIFSGSGMNSNTSTGILLFTDLIGDIKLDNFNISDCEIFGFFDGIAVSSSTGNSGYSNVLIQNSTVHSCLDHGIYSSGFSSSTKIGYSHSNINVSNCEVYNITGYNKPNSHSGNGIVLGNVQYSTIEYCVAYNCGSGNTQCGGPVGIWYYDSDTVTIQHCEAYNISSGTGCDGGGFDLDGGVTNGIMQYNYSHNNDGAGYLVGQYDDARPMDNIIVRYNISEDDAHSNGGSLALFNTDNRPMSNIYFYNNTCYIKRVPTNTLSAGVYMYAITPVNNNIGFYNNIIYADANADLVNIPPGYSAEFFGNLYYSSTSVFNIKFQNITYNSLTDFRATGNEISGGFNFGVQADPLLNDVGNGGIIGYNGDLTSLSAYKISKASPAINQAIDLSWLDTIDFYGNNNTVGGKRDIGAHEYQNTLSIHTMETKASVRIYPNPTSALLTVESSNNAIQKIAIIDLLGREIKSLKAINSSISYLNLSNLPASIYIAHIHTDKGVLTRRIIKN